jgi:hypothetical protein
MQFGRKDLSLWSPYLYLTNGADRGKLDDIKDSNSNTNSADGFTPDVVLKTYIEDGISCTDALVGVDKPELNLHCPYQDLEGFEDSVDRIDESEGSHILESLVAETVFGIVTSGPFAGPFVVEIIRYTGSHSRTRYFWNGHSMLRRELYLCGPRLPERRVAKIWHALHVEGGIQFDNSTVPMTLSHLVNGKAQAMSKDEMFLEYKGEPTSRYFWDMLSEAEKALLSHEPS